MIAVGELPTKACVKSMHAFCFPVHGFVAIAPACGAYTDIHKYARIIWGCMNKCSGRLRSSLRRNGEEKENGDTESIWG
jgi:hypothetical protein